MQIVHSERKFQEILITNLDGKSHDRSKFQIWFGSGHPSFILTLVLQKIGRNCRCLTSSLEDPNI